MVSKRGVNYEYFCKVFIVQYLILVSFLSAIAYAIDAKCSACYAIADELEFKLKKERMRKDSIKSLGGLDQHGKRKVLREVSYDMSELRVIELLEDFCSEMTVRMRQTSMTYATLSENRSFRGQNTLEHCNFKMNRADIFEIVHNS